MLNISYDQFKIREAQYAYEAEMTAEIASADAEYVSIAKESASAVKVADDEVIAAEFFSRFDWIVAQANKFLDVPGNSIAKYDQAMQLAQMIRDEATQYG